MALTQEVPRSTEDDGVPIPADGGGTTTPLRRSRRAVVAGGVTFVLALGGATAAWASWNSAQNRELDEARAQYTSARANADDVERAAARALLAATGIVDDDLAGDLDGLLAAADRADPGEMSRGTRADQAAAWRAAAVDLNGQTAVILSIAEQVTTAHASVAQASVAQAINGLSAAREAAAAALAAAEGKVADESVRTALASSIERADELLAAGDGTATYEGSVAKTAAQVTEQTRLNAQLAADARLRTEATTQLGTATTAVVDAQTAWQAETDRVAAEQAAQAQAAASSSTPSKTSSSTPKSASSGSASSGSTSSGAGTSTSGGQWVVTEEVPLADRCFDEFGNSWDC